MKAAITPDAHLILLGNKLVAAIHTARATLEAMPDEFWAGEQAAIDAAMARPDALMDEILPLRPHTALGSIVLEMARRWAIGEAFGDDLMAG